MNERIHELCKYTHLSILERKDIINSLNMVVLNLMISGSKIGGEEGRVLAVVAEHIQQVLLEMHNAITIDDLCIKMIDKLSEGGIVSDAEYKELLEATRKTHR